MSLVRAQQGEPRKSLETSGFCEFQGFFLPFFPDLKFVPIFRSSNFLCFSEKKYESIFRSNYCYEFHVLSASIFGADFSVWPKNWPKKWPYTHFFKSKYMSVEISQKNLDLKNGWFFRSRFMSAMSQFPYIMRFSCALTHPPKMCATFPVFILKHKEKMCATFLENEKVPCENRFISVSQGIRF